LSWYGADEGGWFDQDAQEPSGRNWHRSESAYQHDEYPQHGYEDARWHPQRGYEETNGYPRHGYEDRSEHAEIRPSFVHDRSVVGEIWDQDERADAVVYRFDDLGPGRGREPWERIAASR
jgi:hypothetical protein